jgi:hypothetical protein
MAAEIKVGIGADIKPLEKGLTDASKEIKAFDQAVDKSLVHNEQAFKKFGKTAALESKKVGVSFQGTSRVLSDAAFGPGAIANNLEALGREFGDLSRIAKESGQSIGKTLVQSLAGGGGLNLALGGLTLALSLASFGMGAWTRAFGDNKKAVDDAKKSNEDFVKSLEQVNQGRLKGAQDAQGELASLRVLFGAYQNANLPLKERKEAYAQLQEKYPAYFANLSFEEKATKKTRDAYDSLTSSILSTARARALENLIAKNAETQLVNRERLLGIAKDLAPILKEENRLRQLAAKFRGQFDEFGQSKEADIILKANLERDKANELLQVSNALKAENLALEQANLRLDAEAQKNVINEVKEVQKLDAVIKQMKPLSEVLSVGAKPLSANVDVKSNAPAFSGKFLEQFNPNLQAASDAYTAWKNELNAQNEMLRQDFEMTFGAIGESIGNAFVNSESPLKAAGAAILGALGGVLVQFGKLAIKAGIASTALATALKNPFNPGAGLAAIAAGIALVAVGSAVKGFAGGLSGNGSGSSGGGSFNPSVGSGFNPSAPATGGGAFQTIFIPNMTIKGPDIVVAFNRQTALNSRTGR